jgi:hypothetical protein
MIETIIALVIVGGALFLLIKKFLKGGACLCGCPRNNDKNCKEKSSCDKKS